MDYEVREIQCKSDIKICNLFHIDQYNWGGTYRPRTYGRMGYIKDEGFYVEITCEEKNPTRIYTKANEPVYLDSAIEAFFCFGAKESGGVRKPCYMNFEMNGNGAMLASIGCERTNRVNLSEELRKLITCTPEIRDDSWKVSLYVPLPVIHALYPLNGETIEIQTFSCNFFKLKESEGETRHFASFSPIDYPEPNFHLPAYFAKCTIV